MSASKHRLYLHLQLAAHHVKKQADRALLDAADLTTAQAAVLSLLLENGGATQRHIAETLGQNESAVTAMVQRLIKLGYISRTRSTVDARAWQLDITENGRLALEHASGPFGDINKTFDKILTADEAATLADYFKRIGQAFSRG